MMNSCLYEANVMHCRIRPKHHRLNHKVFMFYLDLDEIDSVCAKIPRISRNRRNTYSFFDDDHLQPNGRRVREKLQDFLKAKGVADSVGRVMLLTHLRTFGHVFNPVSFYFCYDTQGHPLCAVAEVSNTFREMKLYVLDRSALADGKFVSSREKMFYISPFIDLAASMDFELHVPGEKLFVEINDHDDKGTFFYANMSGRRMELNEANVRRMTWMYPLITLKVIFLIHWHALVLFLKKVPFHRKEDNPHLQKEVLREWRKHSVPARS